MKLAREHALKKLSNANLDFDQYVAKFENLMADCTELDETWVLEREWLVQHGQAEINKLLRAWVDSAFPTETCDRAAEEVVFVCVICRGLGRG